MDKRLEYSFGKRAAFDITSMFCQFVCAYELVRRKDLSSLHVASLVPASCVSPNMSVHVVTQFRCESDSAWNCREQCGWGLQDIGKSFTGFLKPGKPKITDDKRNEIL